MITEQVRIIEALSKDLNRELTINQISKQIRKSYAFTNKYVHNLQKQGIIRQKVIGSAIVCSLDYASEQAIGLLTYNSITSASQNSKRLSQARIKEIEEFSKQVGAGNATDNAAYNAADSAANSSSAAIANNEHKQPTPSQHILSAFMHDSYKVIVARSEEAAIILREHLNAQKNKINVITTQEFEKMIKRAELDKITIIHNHEIFWRMIAKAR